MMLPAHPFNDLAGWIEQVAVLPVMYRFGLMRWEELSPASAAK